MIARDRTSVRADLDRLQAACDPPARLGQLSLTGLVARTETALVYAALGGPFGDREGILKLTAPGYAPLITRELDVLVACAEAEIDGVVRPLAAKPLALRLEPRGPISAVGLALPLCHGGTLLNVLGDRAGRAAGLRSARALEVALRVGSVMRSLLMLPRPLVHGDIRPQNVLLPTTDSPLSELVLVDFDAARELQAPLLSAAEQPDAADALAEDVRGFGELLYQVATGSESVAEAPDPRTGNAAFDALVVRCLRTEYNIADSYVCLADEALWRDLQKALDAEAKTSPSTRRQWPWLRRLVER